MLIYMDYRFDLLPELIDLIVFGMENQEEDFFLDGKSCELVSPGDIDEDELSRYYSLPSWEPNDGYRMMERFILNLKNPVFKKKLHTILTSGKGVFRKFKQALKDNENMKHLWHSYKDSHMKSLVLEWYNELREVWGLEKMATEDLDEVEELLSSDFLFTRDITGFMENITTFDKKAFIEACTQDFPPNVIESLYKKQLEALPPGDNNPEFVIAKTAGEEFAGFIQWKVENFDNNYSLGRIVQLYVLPDFRGLGIAKKLLDSADEILGSRAVHSVEIQIPYNTPYILKALEARGYVEKHRVLVKKK